MTTAVNVRHPSGTSRAKILWKVRDARGRGDAYHEPKIVNREAFGRNSATDPALALDEALRRVEVWSCAGSSTAGGSRS